MLQYLFKLEGQLGVGGDSVARWPGGQADVSEMPAAGFYLDKRPPLYDWRPDQRRWLSEARPDAWDFEFTRAA